MRSNESKSLTDFRFGFLSRNCSLDFYQHYLLIFNIVVLSFRKMPSRPITSCKRYPVSYRDLANNRHELGFYAINAFEARQLAIQFNKFVREHPNSIDRISLRNKVID